MKLNHIVDWEAFVPEFLSAYQGLAEHGRPPYSPIVLLKMLLITYLYNLSERQAEEVVNFQLPVKEFVGLAVDEPAPDHSTLCLFKRRLAEAGQWKYFQLVCDAIVRHALQAGIVMGQIQVVDSVHTVADVDHAAERDRHAKGQPPRDPQATLVQKGKRAVTEPDGDVVTKEIQFLGYKAHVSLNAATGFITSVLPSAGRAADNRQFPHLLEHDMALGVEADTYAGDKAYDDTDLHYRLERAGKHSALRLHAYRTQKKDSNKEVWLALAATPQYEAGLKARYTIERKFGEGKLWHRLGHCRYLGLLRYGIQAYLTTAVMNLKRLVFLLTGVTFRTRERKVCRAAAGLS